MKLPIALITSFFCSLAAGCLQIQAPGGTIVIPDRSTEEAAPPPSSACGFTGIDLSPAASSQPAAGGAPSGAAASGSADCLCGTEKEREINVLREMFDLMLARQALELGRPDLALLRLEVHEQRLPVKDNPMWEATRVRSLIHLCRVAEAEARLGSVGDPYLRRRLRREIVAASSRGCQP